jgi:hypothetical protein
MSPVQRPVVAEWWRRSGERELRELLNEWDPLGVLRDDPQWPRDEYDPYLAPLLTTLRERGDVTGVRDALGRALANMGLAPAAHREDILAERIVAWWHEFFPRPGSAE